MASWKFATTIWYDSVLPRDGMMINPHFTSTGGTPDLDALCLEWVTAVKTWLGIGSLNQIGCKVYLDGAPKPSYPVAQVLQNVGAAPVSPVPREVACCLSFYGGINQKNRRGRLYVPAPWFCAPASMVARPQSAQRTIVGNLATVCADLGDASIKWCVYSPTQTATYDVTQWWVNDEWDIQRRRGLRESTRLTAAIAA